MEFIGKERCLWRRIERRIERKDLQRDLVENVYKDVKWRREEKASRAFIA